MKIFRLLVALAGLVAVLWLPSARAEASGCCRYDCRSTYCTMIDSGITLSEANAWLAECKTNCDQHGEPDPGYCPIACTDA